MNNLSQTCPFCNKKTEVNNRFPQYACNSCAELATDEQGEMVKFFYARFTGGGIQGYYRRNKELIPFLGNTCFIHRMECKAFYDGFGGIIIQPATQILHATIANTQLSYTNSTGGY